MSCSVQAARFALERGVGCIARKGWRRAPAWERVGLDEVVYMEPRDPTWKEAWAVTDDLLRTSEPGGAEKGRSSWSSL